MDFLIEKLEEQGLLTPEAITKATDRQWREGGHLLRHLVETGGITEDTLMTLYQKVLGIHVIQLKEIEIDPEAVWHIPYRIARKYHLIPIKRARKTLVVAMANPMNPRARKAMEQVTDLEIVPLGAKLSEIQEAIVHYYGQKDLPLEWGAFWIRPRREFTLRELEKEGVLATEYVIQQIENFLKSSQAGLFVVGEPGTGKSAVLHAVANALAEEDPYRGILLTQGVAFRDLLQEAYEVGFFPQIREYMASYEVLLMDDIEPLQGAPRFHSLMEWFWSQGGSLLLSATQPLASLNFSPSLHSLFQTFETLVLQPMETATPSRVRVSARSKTKEKTAESGDTEPLTAGTLEYLMHHARERGIQFQHVPPSSGVYPPWLFHGLIDLSKRILNAAEPGDAITLRTIETPEGWIVEFQTKSILLMVGEESIRESFRGHEVKVQKIPDQKGSTTLRIQIVGEES